MDSLFRNQWNNFMPSFEDLPSRYHHSQRRYDPSPPHDHRSQTVRQVPVQPQETRQVPVEPRATPSQKVFSIPVQLLGSGCKRSGSALKIQKTFRGFMVRKSVKKIAAIKSEVDEIEKRTSKKETVELMKREAKERLRVIERLMSLLLRLDSVKGVDSGVRDFRRAVIKKAIALQERVDSAVADEDDDQTVGGVGDDSGVNWQLISETVEDQIKDSGEGEGEGQGLEDGEKPHKDETLEFEFVTPEINKKDCNWNQSPEDWGETDETGSDNQGKTGSTAEPGIKIEGDESESGSVSSEEEDEAAGMEDKKRSRELVARMLEENDKMMGMMVKLFERNTTQTKLLSSLSQRVEQLERALLCERLRRKRRHSSTASSDTCAFYRF